MTATLRRHDSETDDRYLVLNNYGNMFIMPKFRHLMMDSRLVEVEIPEDYYTINKDAIDSMVASTNNFIQNLNER